MALFLFDFAFVDQAFSAPLDTDGDGVEDELDPLPERMARARLVSSRFGLAGSDLEVTIALEDQEAVALDAPLRFTLEATDGATFGNDASEGTILAGGGTSSILVETSGGRVAVVLSSSEPGDVALTVEDSEQHGVIGVDDIFFDFEDNDGGFTHGGELDCWLWGTPVTGLGYAWSGTRVWGCGIRLPTDRAEGWLESPPFLVPDRGAPELRFRHFYSRFCSNPVFVEISVDGGPYEEMRDIPGLFNSTPSCPNTGWEYEPVSTSLSAYAGRELRFRFRLETDVSPGGIGWFIDDFAIRDGTSPVVRFFAPDEDPDGDGLSNEEELRRGTHLLRADTDGDGLADRVETGTGVFVGDADTGTDPLVADTDGGGVRDGVEAIVATDPLHAPDDFERSYESLGFPVAGGHRWSLSKRGGLDSSPYLTIHTALAPLVGHLHLPELSSALVSEDGRTVVFGPAELSGLELTRVLYADRRDIGFVRSVDIVRNPTDHPVTCVLTIQNVLEADQEEAAQATSSGDLEIGADDDWFIGRSRREGWPGFVFAGGASPALRRAVHGIRERVEWATELVIPAGDRVAFASYAFEATSLDAAIEIAEELQSFGPSARAGLPAAIESRIINFKRDTDGDGLPDSFELEVDLDPEDPVDAGGDLDSDGLSNLAELRLGTNATLRDTDGDGVADGDEGSHGTDPAQSDSDGDGTDPYPLFHVHVGAEEAPVGVPEREMEVSLVVRSPDGRVLDEKPLRFSIEAGDSGLFGALPVEGSILDGAGTSRVRVETQSGRVVIPFEPRASGVVVLEVVDSDEVGIVTLEARDDPVALINSGGEAFTDALGRHFEADSSDSPHPYLEPGAARALTTSREIPRDADPLVVSRLYAEGLFQSWREGESGARYAIPVEPGRYTVDLLFTADPESSCPQEPVERRGGCQIYDIALEGSVVVDAFNPTIHAADVSLASPPFLPTRVAIGREFVIDVDELLEVAVLDRGPERFPGDPSIAGVAVYRSLPPSREILVRVLEPDGDEDSDGSVNSAELERGSDPFDPDTDGDGISDGAETGTGIFVDANDTGTDPLRSDTDEDGSPDGDEVTAETDPVDASERAVEVAESAFLSSDGFEVGVDTSTGQIGTTESPRVGLRLLEKDGATPDREFASVGSDPAERLLLSFVDPSSESERVFGGRGNEDLEFRFLEREGTAVPALIGTSSAGPLRVRQLARLHSLAPRLEIATEIFNAGNAVLRDLRIFRGINPRIDDSEGTANDVIAPGLIRAVGNAGGALVLGSMNVGAIAGATRIEPESPSDFLLSSNDPNGGRQDTWVGVGESWDSLAPGETVQFVAVYAVGLDPDAALVSYHGGEASRFVRGDSDGNGRVDLTDGIVVLSYLFQGARAPLCADATDSDDNGRVEITDPVYLFQFLFLGGPEPPAPWPECGEDGTVDELRCGLFLPCE